MNKPGRYLGEEHFKQRQRQAQKGPSVGDTFCDAKVVQSKGQYGWNGMGRNDEVGETCLRWIEAGSGGVH